MVAIAIIAIVVIPLTIIQVQNSQDIRQRAEGVLWATDQSASTSCPAEGEGAVIEATFHNTEPNQSSLAMDVTVKDQQTSKSVTMGTVKGGETKTVKIETGKETLKAGSVTFSLKWSDGHSGTDSRTASYKAVSYCIKPTPTTPYYPTPTVAYPTPTVPYGEPTPTPTICVG